MDNVVTITTSQGFYLFATYYVNIEEGAFKGTTDNEYIGLDSSTEASGSIRFLQTNETVLTSYTPILNKTYVPLDSNIVLTLSLIHI